MQRKTNLIFIIVSVAVLLGIIFAASFWQGVGVDIYKLHLFYWNLEPCNEKLVESLVSSQVSDGGSSEEESSVSDLIPNSSSASSPLLVDYEMLDCVIMCESSNRHEGIWGREGEYGILQWKQDTWDWLSGVLDYSGDIKDREDQIELFLIAVEADYGDHWTCFRRCNND